MLKNLKSLVVVLALSLVVTACTTSTNKSAATLNYGEQVVGNKRVVDLFNKVKMEDNIRNDDLVLIDEDHGLMSISMSERKIFVNTNEVAKFTDEQIMFMFAHELGHVSPQGRPLAGTKAGEQFADYYALLLLDEMNVPILSAISLFHDAKVGGIDAGGDTHGTNRERYERLLAKAKEVGMKL